MTVPRVALGLDLGPAAAIASRAVVARNAAAADGLIALGDGLPVPSNSASVPIASPAAIFGNHFCFCASLPAIISASAAR